MKVLMAPLASPGYVYPSMAVALELRARGAAVSMLVNARDTAMVEAAGIAAVPTGVVGDQRALAVDRWYRGGLEQYLAVSRAVRELSADIVVTTVLCHGALVAAETHGIPVVVIGMAAHLWPYVRGGDPTHEDVVLRQWRLDEMAGRHAELRERVGLRPRAESHPGEALCGDMLLLRGHPDLEEPEGVLPRNVVHVGPCRWEPPVDPAVVDATRSRLADQTLPVVYAHLGRTFGGDSMWPRLNAMAGAGNRWGTIVERGRSGLPTEPPAVGTVVIKSPWLTPFVEIADTVLTNATSAPVLAALTARKPMVVAPNGSEQPLLAAACVRAGVAVGLPPATGPAASTVLGTFGDPLITRAADRLGERMARLGGAAAAADVVRDVAGNRNAVRRDVARTGVQP